MQRKAPLHEHPELCVIEHSGWREYRVDAPGRTRPSASGIPFVGGLWFDAGLALGLACYWKTIVETAPRLATLSLVISLYLYSRLTQVLWESVVIYPMLGVQLETHRGAAGVSLFVSRSFISWSSLEDFLINEGIRGWDIRYYLVAINRTSQSALQLAVAFENILPRFPVLLEVYHAVQEAMQDENEHGSYT